MATALITGGSSGIGAAFARALATRGDDLVLVARDGSRLSAIADELHAAYGIHVETIVADLADRSDVLMVAGRLADESRPIDLLVNNAGFSVRARLLDADLAQHDEGIDVMIRTVLVLGGVAGRTMSARGRGGIITVGSVAGQLTMSAYSAIKAWANSYSQGLSNELRGTGVTATLLMPGWVATEFHGRAGIGTKSIPGFLWLDADRLVRVALRDHARGRAVSIPSGRFVFLSWLLRVIPMTTLRWASWRISSQRRKDTAALSPESTTSGAPKA
jgi:hypothetical protein